MNLGASHALANFKNQSWSGAYSFKHGAVNLKSKVLSIINL